MNSGREKCSLKTTEGSGFLVQSLGRSRNIPAPTDASKTTNTTVGKSQRSCSEKMRLYFQNGPNNHFYFMSFNIQTFFLFFFSCEPENSRGFLSPSSISKHIRTSAEPGGISQQIRRLPSGSDGTACSGTAAFTTGRSEAQTGRNRASGLYGQSGHQFHCQDDKPQPSFQLQNRFQGAGD